MRQKILFLAFLVYSAPVHAARTLIFSVPTFTNCYLSLTSLSQSSQTVHIEVESRSGVTLGVDPGIMGNGATECPTTTFCRLKSAYETLGGFGGATQMSFVIGGASATGTPVTSGVLVKITVDQDQGAVMALANSQIGYGQVVPVVVNGGRPF